MPLSLPKQKKKSSTTAIHHVERKNWWQRRTSTAPMRLHHAALNRALSDPLCSGKVCLCAGTRDALQRLRGCDVFCVPCWREWSDRLLPTNARPLWHGLKDLSFNQDVPLARRAVRAEQVPWILRSECRAYFVSCLQREPRREERQTKTNLMASTAGLSSSRGRAPTTRDTRDGCLLRSARC